MPTSIWDYNRLGFDEQVEQYMRQNPQKHCVMAMIDIDDFKMVNVMYGHAAGEVDALSGATITSSAVTTIVNNTYFYVTGVLCAE